MVGAIDAITLGNEDAPHAEGNNSTVGVGLFETNE